MNANEYAKDIQGHLVNLLEMSIGRLSANTKDQITLMTETGYYFIKAGVSWGLYSPEIAWLSGFNDPLPAHNEQLAERLATLYKEATRHMETPTFAPEKEI